MLTDEQVAAELNHARSWSKRPGWTPQSGECESLADLALVLQERLQAAEQKARDWEAAATDLTRTISKTAHEREELRVQLQAAEANVLELQRHAAVDRVYRGRVQDAMGNGADETLWRPGCLWADEAARLIREASSARQQARREAFEEIAATYNQSAMNLRAHAQQAPMHERGLLLDRALWYEQQASAISSRALSEGEPTR
jgi:hypothetical protein